MREHRMPTTPSQPFYVHMTLLTNFHLVPKIATALLHSSIRLIMTDRKSILLIEDHDIIRRYYAERLRHLLSDSLIIEATTGQIGLDLFQRQTIDCVILDLSLPDMSGFEILPKLVPVAGQPGVPVVVLTAIDNGPLLQAAESKGAFVALQKDLTSADELVTHVRRAMTAIPVEKKDPAVSSRLSISA